jgi:hypothetical protein
LREAIIVIGIALLVMLSVFEGVASAETVCPNAETRVGASANLPDCRAYELVTPVEKNGGEAEVEELGPTGESVLIKSHEVLEPNTTGDISGADSYYTLTRTAGGWMPLSMGPPATEYEDFTGYGVGGGNIGGVSSDGDSTLWGTRRRSDPEPEERHRVDGLYLQRAPGGPLVEVGPMAPPSWPPSKTEFPSMIQAEEEVGTTDVVDYSDDLSHVLLVSTGALFPNHEQDEPFYELSEEVKAKNQWGFNETAEADPALYEYVGTGNTEPLPVGVGNNGKVISECGTELGQRSSADEEHGFKYEINEDNPMSADGRTVFFIARAEGEEYHTKPCHSDLMVNELYARIDNGEPGAHTVAISEPSEADCRACDTEAGVREPAYFSGASEDGSKVFFTTSQPLLGHDTSRNIYEYDFDAPAGERIVRVSGGDSTVSEPEADVNGVSAVSEDGSHVYFIAGGVLTRNPNGLGQVAQPGAANMYVFDTETRTTSFVADLCSGQPGDKELSGSVKDASCPTTVQLVGDLAGGGDAGNDSIIWGSQDGEKKLSYGEEGSEAPRSLDVTPNGLFLVFTSYAELTPGDTSAGAAQAFEYDAQTGSLVRVSIGEEGFNDDGNVDDPYLGAKIVGPGFNVALGHNTSGDNKITVSDNGSFVFFESTDGLTPQALNRVFLGYNYEGYDTEERYANNVYEYHDGHVYLITDGRDISTNETEESNVAIVKLIGTDQSGQDVFFTTNDALVPQDIDNGLDVYDARIDGGFPPPEVRPPCAGDECQGPLSGAPVLLSPGSEFQAGGSNFKPSVNAPVTSKAKAKSKKKRSKRKRSKRKGKSSARRREGRRK